MQIRAFCCVLAMSLFTACVAPRSYAVNSDSEFRGISIEANIQHQKSINSLTITKDNKYILTGSWDRTLKLWDIESGRPVRDFLGHKRGINTAAISNDGKHVVSGDDGGEVILWDFATGNYLYSITKLDCGSIASIVFTPDNKHIIIAPVVGSIELWDYIARTRDYVFKPMEDIGSLIISPDNKQLIFAKNEYVSFVDLGTNNITKEFNGRTGMIKSLAINKDGRYVLSGGKYHDIIKWDTETGEISAILKGNHGEISSISISPDGKYAVSGGFDSSVCIWDFESGDLLSRLFDSYYSYTSSLTYSSDGKKLFAAFDKNILFWDFEKKEKGILTESPSEVYAIDFSPNNDKILTGGLDGIARLWSIESGKQLWAVSDTKGLIGAVAISPDGRYAAYAGHSKIVYLLDIRNGKPIRSFAGHDSWIYDIKFSPDGRQLVSGGLGGDALVWDVNSGQILHTLSHSVDIERLAYSDDGKYILAFSSSGVSTWDSLTAEISTFFSSENSNSFFPGQSNSFFAVEVDDHGSTIQEYDLKTGAKTRSFQNPDGATVSSINISHNNNFIVAGFFDGSLKLWDISSGNHIKTIIGHKDIVNKVFFSSDDRILVSCSNDGTVKMWNISTEKEIVSFVGINNDSWVTSTPEGYFISSNSMPRFISVKIGNQYFQINKSAKNILFNTDIVKFSIKYGDSIVAANKVVGQIKHMKNIEEVRYIYR